ncbi:MAG: triose-phosphate isomerase [Clostridiales Family XIII bacterium]|jgi:triosephosphate isomerase|nr:triose-phosphate isomerase [Clostridiales Family XIII bacterium]
MARKKLIAGNWKMYKTMAEAVRFAEEFTGIYGGGDHEVAICAPFTQLAVLKAAFAGSDVKLGAQNMHFEEEGAYTGEISPAMLTEIGVDYVVIGHSERRQYFAETDETVNKKVKKAFAHGLAPIMCVGEVLEQRDEGVHFDVVKTQVEGGISGLREGDVKRLVIAYEPVWAIGTGRTATGDQAEEMCAFIREVVRSISGDEAAEGLRVQYGGSVKPANAIELMTKGNIDGALVGGASLVPADFKAIIEY